MIGTRLADAGASAADGTRWPAAACPERNASVVLAESHVAITLGWRASPSRALLLQRVAIDCELVSVLTCSPETSDPRLRPLRRSLHRAL
eukprot:5325545-Prymnesium_polylepis.1